MKIEVVNADVLDGLAQLPDESVDCVITSPPYWGLRDYGVEGQLGIEKTPEEYVGNLVKVFREVRRVLKKEGTVWLNLGDSYAGTGSKGDYKDPKYAEGRNGQKVALNNKIVGLKPKDLVGIPWRVAFALQADGWWLRQDIIWHKPNPMPESVTDRCTKAHEYIFLLTKSKKYYFDNEAIKEDGVIKKGTKGAKGSVKRSNEPKVNSRPPEYKIYDGMRNKRSVWTITTKPYKGAHFATFPPDLVEPMVKAGCPKEGVVLDIFAGSGTTLQVAKSLGRSAIGIELNPDYIPLIKERVGWGQQALTNIDYELTEVKTGERGAGKSVFSKRVAHSFASRAPAIGVVL